MLGLIQVLIPFFGAILVSGLSVFVKISKNSHLVLFPLPLPLLPTSVLQMNSYQEWQWPSGQGRGLSTCLRCLSLGLWPSHLTDSLASCLEPGTVHLAEWAEFRTTGKREGSRTPRVQEGPLASNQSQTRLASLDPTGFHSLPLASLMFICLSLNGCRSP